MSPVVPAAAIVFLEGLVLWAVFPVTSFYCEQLGGGPKWVGLMFALLSLPKIVSNPLFGRWSDKLGRRPLLVVASTGTLLGSVGWALAPTLGWLAASRLVAGLFSGQATLCQSVVVDSTPPARRAHALGLVGAAFGLSMVIGPLCGGWTAHHLSHAAVGWMCAMFQAVSLAIALFLLPETNPGCSTTDSGRRGRAEAARDRAARSKSSPTSAQPTAFVTSAQPTALASSFEPLPPPAPPHVRTTDGRIIQLMAVSFLMALVVSQFTSTVPLLMERVYDFSEVGAAGAFAAFGLVGVVAQGGLLRVLLRYLRPQRVGVIGFACMFAGFAVVASLPRLALLSAGITLVGIGTALTMPTVTALLSSALPAHVQGVALGSQQSVLSLARGVGALVAGGLYEWTGPSLSYACASTLGLLALFLLWATRLERSALEGPEQPTKRAAHAR